MSGLDPDELAYRRERRRLDEEERRSRRWTAIAWVAILGAAIGIIVWAWLVPDDANSARADDGCPGKPFAWGGEGRCWSADDGDEFGRWLVEHGSSPARFEENYPELADVFREPWPPPPEPPYWKTCETGRACAAAVIGHVFGGDISYEMSIVGCETGWTYSSYAVGDAGERGLWQIHPVHFGWADPGRLFEPLYNTVAAYRLSEGGSDFSPWTCA